MQKSSFENRDSRFMYAPARMLSESLVPDEPLSPSSTPESQGAGPNQMVGAYQGPSGSSTSTRVDGSASAAATAGSGSFYPGIGNSAAGPTDGTAAAGATAGGCHASDGGSTAGAPAASRDGANVNPGPVCATDRAAGTATPIVNMQSTTKRITNLGSIFGA